MGLGNIQGEKKFCSGAKNNGNGSPVRHPHACDYMHLIDERKQRLRDLSDLPKVT